MCAYAPQVPDLMLEQRASVRGIQHDGDGCSTYLKNVVYVSQIHAL